MQYCYSQQSLHTFFVALSYHQHTQKKYKQKGRRLLVLWTDTCIVHETINTESGLSNVKLLFCSVLRWNLNDKYLFMHILYPNGTGTNATDTRWKQQISLISFVFMWLICSYIVHIRVTVVLYSCCVKRREMLMICWFGQFMYGIRFVLYSCCDKRKELLMICWFCQWNSIWFGMTFSIILRWEVKNFRISHPDSNSMVFRRNAWFKGQNVLSPSFLIFRQFYHLLRLFLIFCRFLPNCTNSHMQQTLYTFNMTFHWNWTMKLFPLPRQRYIFRIHLRLVLVTHMRPPPFLASLPRKWHFFCSASTCSTRLFGLMTIIPH